MTRPQVDAADRWFLQIKGQIIGPMPAERVLARLLDGELTVMSRVSQDRTNWRAICNTAVFEELVNERIRAYSGKSEIVGQFGPNTQDDTPFETSEVNFNIVQTNAVKGISEQLDHARQLEELTANIQKLNHLRKEIIQNKRTITVEKESESDEAHPEDQNIFIPKTQRSSGLKQFFAKIQSGDLQSRRLAIGSLVLIAGGILSIAAYHGYELYSADANAQQATSAQDSGYAEATAQLEKEKGAVSANPEDLLKLAEEHLKAKRAKESQDLSRQVLTMNAGTEIQAQAHALIAAAAAQLGETDVAISEYARAIKIHEMHTSLHNLGVLQLKAGNPKEAERYLLKAMQVATPQSVQRSLSLLALFESARTLAESQLQPTGSTETDGANQQQNPLDSVLPFIEDELKTAEAIRPSLLLARLYIEHVRAIRSNVLPSAQPGFQLAAVDFVNHPISLTLAGPENNDNLTPSQGEPLDNQFASWQSLVHRCAAIYKHPPVNAFTAAIYATCLSRSHGAASALPFAKYASDLNANDPVFGGLYLALLIKAGQAAAAKAFLAAHPDIADLSRQAKQAVIALQNLELREAAPAVDERQPATAE